MGIALPRIGMRRAPPSPLARPAATWQGRRMTSGPRTPMAGGFAIALFSIVGVIGGSLKGQPTIGLLGGFAAGVAVALTVWLVDRRRG